MNQISFLGKHALLLGLTLCGCLRNLCICQDISEVNKDTNFDSKALRPELERVLRLSLTAIEYGELTINTYPKEAKIYLNNQYVKVSPLRSFRIEAGKHRVRVEASDQLYGQPKYLPKEQIITIIAGQLSNIFIKLTPNFGTLEIITTPRDANINVSSQSGRITLQRTSTPIKMELLPGKYTINISKKPIFESQIQVVSIDVGRAPKPLNVELVPIPFIRERFTLIPAGEFTMGSSLGGQPEKPEHKVKVAEFWMRKYEVTVNEYAEFVRASKYREPIIGNKACNWGKPDRGNHPVNCVSWYDARAYAEWISRHNGYGLKFRLPTEAEWEKAARGLHRSPYPWGNNFDGRRANFSDKNSPEIVKSRSLDDGYATTAPVGSYEGGKSSYGVYNLAGNVWEWTQSLYRSYPYSNNDGRESLNVSGERVIRGGAWNSVPEYLQSFVRFRKSPNDLSDDLGFRLVFTY